MTYCVACRGGEGEGARRHLRSPYAGKAGWQDWTIAEFAFDNDLIAVTNNRRDFLKEYARRELHPGLVVIVPKGNRSDQIAWFSTVLDFLLAMDEPPINKLVEIDADGRISMLDWSGASA